MAELHDLTALEQGELVRRREVSPVELVEHYLERAHRIDDDPSTTVGAFVTLTDDLARARASARDAGARRQLAAVRRTDGHQGPQPHPGHPHDVRLAVSPTSSDAGAHPHSAAMSLGRPHPEIATPRYTGPRPGCPRSHPTAPLAVSSSAARPRGGGRTRHVAQRSDAALHPSAPPLTAVRLTPPPSAGDPGEVTQPRDPVHGSPRSAPAAQDRTSGEQRGRQQRDVAGHLELAHQVAGVHRHERVRR